MPIFNTTTIVNIRYHKCDISCGRPSIFSNPYIIGRDGTRDDVCDLYNLYFYKKIKNDIKFKSSVLQLKNMRIGCWCRCLPSCNNPKCKPLRCHLETIVEYLNSL